MGDVELQETDAGAECLRELLTVASKLSLTEFVVQDKVKKFPLAAHCC